MLSGGLSIDKSVPVFPGISVKFFGSMDAQVDLKFGFDTLGIREFSASAYVPDLLDGFYISDTANLDGSGADVPEFTFTATIGVGVEFGVDIPAVAKVTVGAEGGIQGTVNLNLHDLDPDGDGPQLPDGRIRGSEIARIIDINPLCLFDTSGKIDAFLRLTADVIAFPDTFLEFTFFEWEYELARITLFNYNVHPNCDALDFTPELATRSGDVLTLNTGPAATAANFGGPFTVPTDETYSVSHVSTQSDGTETVSVSRLRVPADLLRHPPYRGGRRDGR